MPALIDAGSDGGAVAALKANTRDWHRQLDRQSLLSVLVSPALTPDIYREVLCRLLPIHQRIEAALCPYLENAPRAEFAVIDRALWHRSGDLVADILSLHGEPGSCPGAEAAAARPAPDLLLHDVTQAWGCLYVIGGASLGGQIIARRVLAQLGAGAARSLQFFHGRSVDAGVAWRALCSSLESALHEPRGRLAAIAKAQETFAYYAGCLDRSGPMSVPDLLDCGAGTVTRGLHAVPETSGSRHCYSAALLGVPGDAGARPGLARRGRDP
jgi:heme oxygenase